MINLQPSSLKVCSAAAFAQSSQRQPWVSGNKFILCDFAQPSAHNYNEDGWEALLWFFSSQRDSSGDHTCTGAVTIHQVNGRTEKSKITASQCSVIIKGCRTMCRITWKILWRLNFHRIVLFLPFSSTFWTKSVLQISLLNSSSNEHKRRLMLIL